MADLFGKIDSSIGRLGNTGVRQGGGVDGPQSRKGRNEPGVTGGPGQRILSPDVPVESLDRSAPRGTYLDLLV